MPSLRARIEALHLRPGDVIMEEWYEQLESLLKDITEEGAVTYDGYITRDLIPTKDLTFDIGKPLKRIREIHAGYGYFLYGIFPHTTLLGIKQDFIAPEMQDVFDEHLTILFNGIARVKAKHEYDFYAYLYWIPKATGMGQLAALNEGKPIPAVVWKEMDFTVSKDDKVNVRVKPSGKVTIAIYNIPS